MKGEWGGNSGGKNRLSVTTGNPCMWQSAVWYLHPARQEETRHTSSERAGGSSIREWRHVREWEMTQETNNKPKEKGNTRRTAICCVSLHHHLRSVMHLEGKKQSKTQPCNRKCPADESSGEWGLAYAAPMLLYCTEWTSFKHMHGNDTNHGRQVSHSVWLTDIITIKNENAADADEHQRWSCGSVFLQVMLSNKAPRALVKWRLYIKRLLFCGYNTPPTVSSYCTAM